MATCSYDATQVWHEAGTVSSPKGGTPYFHLVNPAGTCLGLGYRGFGANPCGATTTLPGGAEVPDPRLHWYADSAGPGSVRLRNRATGEYLSVSADGAPVLSADSPQTWQLLPEGAI